MVLAVVVVVVVVVAAAVARGASQRTCSTEPKSKRRTRTRRRSAPTARSKKEQMEVPTHATPLMQTPQPLAQPSLRLPEQSKHSAPSPPQHTSRMVTAYLRADGDGGAVG